MTDSKDLEAAAPESGHIGDDPPKRGKTLGVVPETTLVEKATMGLAAATVGVAGSAMVIASGSTTVLVAGGTSSVMGPYAVYQSRKLTDIAAMKETLEKMQEEVNRLEKENERLGNNIEELNETVKRLEDLQEAFDALTEKQGQNVDTFAEQVEENKNILRQMKKNLRANVLQNLLSVIIRCDTDHSFSIDETETDELVTRIKGINGVSLKDDLFRETITKSNGSLHSVIDVVKDLLTNKSNKNSDIFTIKHC